LKSKEQKKPRAKFFQTGKRKKVASDHPTRAQGRLEDLAGAADEDGLLVAQQQKNACVFKKGKPLWGKSTLTFERPVVKWTRQVMAVEFHRRAAEQWSQAESLGLRTFQPEELRLISRRTHWLKRSQGVSALLPKVP
jgi:cytochrome P450